jgi:hypothetical protein
MATVSGGRLEGKTFNELVQLRQQPTMLASVGTPLSTEASQAVGVIAL